MRVNRVSTHPAEVDVIYNGEQARAVIPEMHVELYDAENGVHGSIELRFRSQHDINAANAVFSQGHTVVMSFKKEAEPKVISTEADEHHPEKPHAA